MDASTTPMWAADRIGVQELPDADAALPGGLAGDSFKAGKSSSPLPSPSSRGGLLSPAARRKSSAEDKSSSTRPSTLPTATRGRLMPPPPPCRKIHFNELGDGGLSNMRYLGSGEFCSVYSTKFDGGHSIAVKMLRGLSPVTVSGVFYANTTVWSEMSFAKSIWRAYGVTSA